MDEPIPRCLKANQCSRCLQAGDSHLAYSIRFPAPKIGAMISKNVRLIFEFYVKSVGAMNLESGLTMFHSVRRTVCARIDWLLPSRGPVSQGPVPPGGWCSKAAALVHMDVKGHAELLATNLQMAAQPSKSAKGPPEAGEGLWMCGQQGLQALYLSGELLRPD